MKVSLRFLSDYVKSEFYNAPKAYCDRMTDTGSKVEGYEIAGEEIQNVVIGEILSVAKHPDADRLNVCKVNVGKENPIQVVTAANNIFAGAHVPVALDGALLPGDVKIKSGKLRGEVSEGMFCSIAELNLTLHDMPGADEDGILILEADAPIGKDIKEYLLLTDTIVEFEITPNRPDCLSVIGIAKETAASFDAKACIPMPEVKGGAGKIEEYISVEVQDPDLCKRYCARAITDVKIEPSPLWLRSRLRMMGIRPINNIVDITNLVMLEYGQPMHAFDGRELSGEKIIVRRAKLGERMTTLDGSEHELQAQMLMICDEQKPVGIAGIMGGENSEIKEDTKTVIFESATFAGASIRRTAKALGLRTESSSRFEKGLDPENAFPALQRACELLELLGAGKVCDGVIDVYPEPRKQTVLPIEVERTNEFLGIQITKERYIEILQSLDFIVEGNEIFVPFARQDVTSFADIAEEIARIYGYNNIPATRFSGAARVGGRGAFGAFQKSLHEMAVSLGFYEIQTYSFISEKFYDALLLPRDDVRRESVKIANPLGEDTALMRTTAVSSMLEVLGHNYNYKNAVTRLYEMARLYRPIGAELPEETRCLCLGGFGNLDFFSFKGICEGILMRVLGEGTPRRRSFEIVSAQEPFLHPGRSAKMLCGEEELCLFGEVHPKVAENFGIDTRTYVAAFSVEALYSHRKAQAQFQPLPRFPAIARDLSLVCEKDATVGETEKLIAQAAGKKLEQIKLFDTYVGEQIPNGKKGLSFALTLRDSEKTLTDEEADKITAKIVRVLGENGITLRA